MLLQKRLLKQLTGLVSQKLHQILRETVSHTIKSELVSCERAAMDAFENEAHIPVVVYLTLT